MTGPLDIHAPGTAEAVVALQGVAYRVEAALLGIQDLPPLSETPFDLLTCGETFLAERDDAGALKGVLGYQSRFGRVEICRLMVAPAYFRQGVASRLLEALTRDVPGWKVLSVATGAGNEPALALYRKHGFEVVSTRPVRIGLRILSLERRA